MASPQLEDGFCQIANELLAAIFVAGFGRYEQVIVMHALLCSYGPEKQKTFKIDHLEMAQMCRIDRRNLSRTVRNLVQCGVLRQAGLSRYAIVKDYDKWMIRDKDSGDPSRPFAPRIVEADRELIRNSVSSFSAKPAPQPPAKRSRIAKSTASPRTPESMNPVSPVTPGSMNPVFPVTPNQTECVGSNGKPPLELGKDSSRTPVPPDPRKNRRILKKESYTDSSRASKQEIFDAFASPPSKPEPAVPMSKDAEPLHAHILKITASAKKPDGNRDMADHAVKEFEAWRASGHSAAAVKEAIHKTLQAKGGKFRQMPIAFSSYLRAILAGHAAELADRPDAPPSVLPSQTKPQIYLTPSPRPRPLAGPKEPADVRSPVE